MGDGVEPIFRGVMGCAVAGLVGLVHGAADAIPQVSKQIPPLAHESLVYLPFIGAAAFTAASKYGLWTPGARMSAAAYILPAAAACEGAGYLLGKVISFGVQRVLDL